MVFINVLLDFCARICFTCYISYGIDARGTECNQIDDL